VLTLSLDGKVAAVTGAGRGLGQACAVALARAGADVALLARSTNELAETGARVEAEGRRALVIPTDVTDERAVQAAVETTLRRFSRIDVLVNNAGIAPVAPLLKLELAELHRVLEVNVVGTILCSRAFGAHMVAQRSGTIINIASIAGLNGEPELTAYCASKGAVIAFSRALAVEWARHQVRVNAVAPGIYRTDHNKQALDDEKIGPKIRAHIPLRRTGEPEELGPLIAYVASDAAAFMTGAVVTLDGGQTAR
jgi:2-deoxy-D-gluconate 3-dehydrogenase